MVIAGSLFIPVSILFISIFLYFLTNASDNLFAIYTSKPKAKPKKSLPKQNKSEISNEMPFIPAKINNEYNEQKEYEETKLNKGNISPLSDHDDSNNKYSLTNNRNEPNDNNKNESNDNTTALAYFLELQSRLQHLQSLLSTDINENTFHSVNESHQSNDMITEIHSNNMTLIESIIQNVIYNQSHGNVMEADKNFYNKLNDNNANWGKPMKDKRRQSIEQKIYKNIDYTLGYMIEMTMKLTNNSNLINLITSVVVLYSSGVLYYCVENNVNVSIISYIFGIILVFIVICIGYLFSISKINNINSNEFISAIVLSIVLIYFAYFWISYYFNITVTFILIMAIILSYSYKHGPIYAKQRHFDEIWVCLLLNCGLPLFAYYLQLELQIKEEIIPEEIINVVEVKEPEEITWQTYIFDIIYYIITWILNDMWSMMDITYALDETVHTESESPIPPKDEPVVNSTTTTTTTTTIADTLFNVFPYKLFNIILITWFITHSSMLIRNVSLYKSVNTKLLYCAEIMLAYVLSIVFWYNNMFDITVFYGMIITIPWIVGLLRHIWEHKNIQNDQLISQHTQIFNLWVFIFIYLSFVYNWVYQNGIFYSLFSTNLLIVTAPFYFIIQCFPQILKEFAWATDF